MLAGSTLQNSFERISKPLEEQCDEFVPLVSLRFQGVKTIDVIEESRPAKNSVAFEPGDLEVDFVWFFSMFWGRQCPKSKNNCSLNSSPPLPANTYRHSVHEPLSVLTHGTPVRQYTGTPVHWYTGTPIHWCTSTPVHRYTGTPVHLYSSTSGHRYKVICNS